MPVIAHVHSYTFDELAEIVIAPLYAKFGDVSVAISEDRVSIWVKDPVPLAAGEAAPVQTRAFVAREEADKMAKDGEIAEEKDEKDETRVDRFFYHVENDKLIMMQADDHGPIPDPEEGWDEIDEAKYLDIRADMDRQKGMDLGGGNGAPQQGQDEREGSGGQDDKPKGGKLAQRAGIICGEKAFWRFMDCENQDQVVAEIREACGIQSRAELDSNEKAAAAFKEIDLRYKSWLNGND